MSLDGNTLFAGDSMTVGLSPFVQVNGLKRTMAEVSRTSAWLVQQVKGTDLHSAKNIVVLIGANDIGQMQPETTIANTLAIWDHAKAQGIRVIGQTLPPFRGWAPYMANFSVIEGRRKAINAALVQAAAQGRADQLVDLSSLMADPSDPTKLASSFDSGDHLHPRKDAHGALLTRVTGSAPLPPLPAPSPSFPLVPVPPLKALASSNTGLLLLLVGAGGIAFLLTRKRAGSLGWR